MNLKNFNFKKGILYIIEVPTENEVNFLFKENYKFEKPLFFHYMEFDHYFSDFAGTITDTVNLFDLDLELLFDDIDINTKIRNLSNFHSRCLDYLIKSKKFQVITSLEALSENSRDKYILFLKKISVLYSDSYTICLDYPSNRNHIDSLKINILS